MGNTGVGRLASLTVGTVKLTRTYDAFGLSTNGNWHPAHYRLNRHVACPSSPSRVARTRNTRSMSSAEISDASDVSYAIRPPSITNKCSPYSSVDTQNRPLMET